MQWRGLMIKRDVWYRRALGSLVREHGLNMPVYNSQQVIDHTRCELVVDDLPEDIS